MVGMVLLALLALQSAWRALRVESTPTVELEPRVPVAHW